MLPRLPIGTRTVCQDGYVLIKTEEGWKYEHRVVMEQHLGRRLLRSEDVHHKNEVRSDNALGNLELKPHGKHTSEHHKGKPLSTEARVKIGEARRGWVPGEATRARMAASARGRALSSETRAKLSAALKAHMAANPAAKDRLASISRARRAA